MNNKMMLSLSISLLMLANIAIANTISPPIQCPNLSQVQAAGWSKVVNDPDEPDSLAFVQFKNNYGTDNEWTFILRNIHAKNEHDAIERSIKLVSTLNILIGPIPIDPQGKVWSCAYDSSVSGIYAEAFTPPMTPPIEGTMRALHVK